MIVVANLIASLVQYLSAKLGLVTGLSLPEAVALRPSVHPAGLLDQAELVAMADRRRRVVGGAIALYLLFRLPLLWGGVITGAVSLALLAIQNRRGQRAFERVIVGLLAVIAIGFLSSLFIDHRLRRGRFGTGAPIRQRRERVAGHCHAWARRSCRRRLPAFRADPRSK